MSAAQKLEALQEMRNADSSVTAADFESRITDLRNHIDGTLGGVVDKVGGIENKVMSAAQQLETLQEMRSTDPDVAKQMALMEERLVGAAKRLEEASIDAASSNGGAPVALLDAVSNKELKQELDNLEARLGEAIKSGQEPANMLTPEQLKDELGGLADHLTQRLESKGSATGQAVVTDDILKDGLADLAHQVTERFTSERSIMLDHIDAAISKLQSLSPPSSTSSDDAIKVDGLQDGINGLQSSTESLSAQTQSSFESVQEMLNNVTERLHALEVSGSTVNNEAANNNPVDTSDAPELSQDTKSDSNNLSSKESVDKNTTKLIDDTPADLSVMSDEAIMERMREHVKARHPDEEPIEPSADDVPLKPGAGKPALEPVVFEEKDQVKATQARSDVEVQLENSAVAPTQKEEVRQEEAPQEPEPQEEAPRQSKSDFIAAARRAAQRASNEQSSLVEEIEEENSGSALSSIRDRISGAGKKVKPRRRGDKAATVDAALQNSPDAAQKFNEDLLDGSKGKVTRVKALSGVLAATLLISGYFTLKEPINELVSGLSQSTAAVERVSSPQQAAISIPAARPAQQIPVKPASQQAQVLLDVEQGADSDEAALDIASSGIDTSTTQSISPTNDIVEDVNLDPVLREALEGLPDEGISSKLADALIAANPSAFVEVARRFGQGDIFPRDIQQSAFWYKQAADRENPVAQYRLGTLYEEGIGVSKDVNEARRWYLRASDNGNALAMHNIAVLHTEGAFGEVDFKEGFKWFERGASYGIKDSQFNLGILYVRGLGIEASLPQAYKWFDIVAKRGDTDAAAKRDDVEKALKPDQLAAAKEESANWKKLAWIDSANVVTPAPSYWRDGTVTNASVIPQEQPHIPRSSPLVKEAQILMQGLGFDTGGADGVIGSKTIQAVRSFEYELGLPQTGKINQKLVDILRAQKI